MELNVVENLTCDESESQAFASVAGSSSNSVNVSFNISGKIVIDNHINIVNVYKTKPIT